MSLYDEVRANVDKSSGEERVEVNQRALIDKILARYASAGAVYRELLQNSNDAEATTAEVWFTTKKSEDPTKRKNIVTQVQYRNNGMPFRPQDWARLKKIAEGNPDESKIGAFGVGAYTMFSICEEPIVLSGNQALAFVWKGDALWTKTIDNDNGKDNKWTTFILPSRDPYVMPDLKEFGEFLCASLTFTRCLREIRLFVDGKQRMTIVKTQIQEPTPVQIQRSSKWWKSDGAATASPSGLFSLKDENSIMESFYHVQVTLDGEVAAVTARYISATAKTKVSSSMAHRMERVTKKKPPSKVEVQIFLNGQQQVDETNNRKNKAYQIVQSFSPRIGEGRIFIGFRTSQTTGLAAHLGAPFIPTVEREAMDLQDQTLRVFNMELLEFSGILMRLTLEHGMSTLGVDYANGAVERAKLEEKLIKEEREKLTSSTAAVKENAEEKTLEKEDSMDDDGATSSVWGFAKFMARGVKKTIVKVVQQVEELVDDGGELMHPLDPRPLCAEEHQAILLMQSFCPRQSTPDPLVGTAIAQGFSRCLPDKAPPCLTRSGVVPGDKARLPYKGMEAFCKDDVVRSIVYQNAEEYHKYIAQCEPLSLDDLSDKLATEVLEEKMLVRFLKWWARFCKTQQYISDARSLDIKERVQFFMDYKTKSSDSMPVFKLRDFLFYLDEDKIRVGNGFTLDTLPMPDSIVPKVIQDKVTFRTLTDKAFESWFEPLPIEIWVDFISHHPCMAAGQPEDEKLRLQVLSTLAQEFSRRPLSEQSAFGSFCEGVLRQKRCIPFDSNEPTSYSAATPSSLYLSSAELKAFDGIGNFHKASDSLKHVGVSDDFLLALGVRKSVAIDFLFGHLDTLKWSSDPKPLIEYLRSATLTRNDQKKLKSTQYLPAENDVSRMFAPSELYLPDRDLRIFPFLRLLQWPSGDYELTERSANGSFLVGLGMGVLPPLIQILKYIATQVEDDAMRVKCLEFVTKRLGSGGVYQGQYERISRNDKANLKILPCILRTPLAQQEKKGLYSVLGCCSDERCAVMGFPVIDPALGETGKLFGSLFKVAKEPDQSTLIKQLLNLVEVAKQLVKKSSGEQRKAVSVRVVETFLSIFNYLSSRTSDISSASMANLEQQDFIPVLVDGEAQWLRPDSVFFKSTDAEGESVTDALFHSVDFSPFLAAAGVKQEASTKDIFRLMIQDPHRVLRAVGSEAKYRMFLRRVAAHRPFRRVTTEIRDSPFLVAYTVADSNDTSNYELAKAKDIYIIDNSFFGRMFQVKRAPHESDLEDFYSLIGAKYISKEVNKKYDVIGTSRPNTELTKALLERISERSPLLVSPSVTSRPLVNNAAEILDEKHLEVYEASDIKAVYSLGKSVRTQRTTCCCQPGLFNRSSLYVTPDFDWFDVGYAIGEMILQRCQLEDAFFISSLLEAPLEQLRARGFPVDRIIKPEPIPEPEPEPVRPTASRGVAADGATASQGTAVSAPPTPPQDTVNGVQSAPNQVDASAPKQADSSAPKQADSSGDRRGKSEKWPNSTAKSSAAAQPNSEPPISADGYVEALKQMYPDADESFIRARLGENPTLDRVRSLAEEMATTGYPKDSSSSVSTAETQESETKPSKFLGSKKLGRAFNGLRGGNNGGRLRPTASEPNSVTAPTHQERGRGNVPATPESDAVTHSMMERMLEDTVAKSTTVNSNGVRAPETQLSMPEGLERGTTCEVIPGQDLKPFTASNSNGETHNHIKIFSSRKHQSSELFLQTHADAVESFAVVLERLCGVFGLPLSTIAIFHDPTGGTIAFNSNRSLHFNVRFFFGLHYAQNLHQSRVCYSYWYVTFAHELAHHMAPGHNVEHGFYTESYISLYLPKMMALLSQLE